ncbi:MAG: B12-binding domain-containing radical SAM protein [Candidatus Omnitrophica bacterium]|nr:B12-binding domain-containing radical SAM protein [Candidatus Omnitrophota bacterium]
MIQLAKQKVLMVLPYHHPNFINFLPEFEPYAFLILGTMVQDIAEVQVLDMRYEKRSALPKKIKEFQPDVIGIRAHTAADTDTTLEIAQTCRASSDKAMIVIGGQGCTLQPHDFNSPNIDVMCLGHADRTFRELLEAKQAGRDLGEVPGIVIVKEGQLQFTASREISSGMIAWPALRRDLVARYRKHYDGQMTLTSMGCPWRCKFCTLWIVPQGAYLLREPENIVDDIASCDSQMIYIGDDNTFHNYRHAMKVAELLEQRGIKKHYGAYARTDTICKYPDLFRRWAKLGLIQLVVGFEAFKPEDLAYVNKRNSIENNTSAAKILNEAGITALAHFISFPDFTVKDFKDLWNYVDSLNVTYPIFVPLTPLPGTPTFNEAKEKDELDNFDLGWYNLEYMVFKTKLPKWRWYAEQMLLWYKSVSPMTFLKRHRNAGWSLAAYLFRLRKVLKATPKYVFCMAKQLWAERRFAKGRAQAAPTYKTFQKGYVSPYVKRVLEKVPLNE